MGIDRRTLARWGPAFGGPVLGSLLITGSLAVGLPLALEGERRVAVAPASPAEPPPVAAPSASAPSDSAPARAQPVAVEPHPRPVPPPPRRPPPRAVVPASVRPDAESEQWFRDEEERQKELTWQQGNMFKQMVDAVHAYHGVDTSQLTFEEISGGRRMRGREKFLARQRALENGAGGAPPEAESDSDWSDYVDDEAPDAGGSEAGDNGPVESTAEESTPVGK